MKCVVVHQKDIGVSTYAAGDHYALCWTGIRVRIRPGQPVQSTRHDLLVYPIFGALRIPPPSLDMNSDSDRRGGAGVPDLCEHPSSLVTVMAFHTPDVWCIIADHEFQLWPSN